MTLVVAHRGSSAAQAEHTLGAYEKAIDEGADALECDVRLTKDGVLVCVHDRRVNRTSDGRGKVSTLELAELAELDFASWKAQQGDPLLEASWVEYDPERGGVLTLERLLQLVADCGRRVEMHIETKHPTRYGGLVEKSLVDVLARYGLANPSADSAVTVMSFAPTSLRRIHQLAPKVPTVYLMSRVPLLYRDGSLPPRIPITGPSLEILKAHPRYVERVHEAGNRVHVWTVDEVEDIGFVLGLGVDAVISNHPRRVLRQLERA